MFVCRSVAASVLSAAVLGGCSTAWQQGAATPPVPASHGRISPQAASGDLLYLSDVTANVVYVYSYPSVKRVGTLKKFVAPRGECSSTSGDVWIVDSGTYAVLEYPHGAALPVRALNIEGVPQGCAVDPVTGDLAVSSKGTSVTVTVFHAHKKWAPFHFRDSQMKVPAFCGYDAKGDLFVDGFDKSKAFRIDELVQGGTALGNVSVNGASIKSPGQIQWDGSALAIGDTGVAPSVIYQFTVGTGGLRATGSTTLAGTTSVRQWWIAGSTLVGPDFGKDVGFWRYPAGGSATKVLNAVHGYGATLSAASP